MPALARVIVEIDVRVELLPAQVFMRSPTHVLRIVEQFRNGGDAAQQFEKTGVAHQLIETSVRRTKAGQVRKYCFAADLASLIHGPGRIKRWKLFDQLLIEFLVEKLIDHHVPKGLSGFKLLTKCGRAIRNARM